MKPLPILCALSSLVYQQSVGQILKFQNEYYLISFNVGSLVNQLLLQMQISTIQLHFNPEKDRSVDYSSKILFDYDGSVLVNTYREAEIERAAVIVESTELLNLTKAVAAKPNQFNFYIIIVDGEEYQSSGLVERAFEQLWQLKIINVRLIFVYRHTRIDNTLLSMYDYVPYDGIDCGNASPLLLSSFVLRELEPTKNNVSFRSELKNFNGCPLSVGIAQLPPYIVEQNINETWNYSGLEIDLMTTVADHLNFKIRLIRPPDGLNWGELEGANSTGMLRTIYLGEVDFGIGSLARNLKRNTELKAGVENFFDIVIFAVPPGIPYTAMEKLLLPFSPVSWIGIAIVCIVTALYLKLYEAKVFRQKIIDQIRTPLLDVWLVLMGGGVVKPPSTDKNRFVIIGWFYTSLVLRTYYQAILFGHLNAGVEYKPIHGLTEIENGDLRYCMYNITQRLFVDMPRIKSRTKIVPDDIILFDWLGGITDNALKCAFPLPRSTVTYFNRYRTGNTPHCHYTRYVVEGYAVGAYYPKNSPLTSTIDNVVLRIHAAGLQQSWVAKYRGLEGTLVHSEHKPMTVQDLLGAFLIHTTVCGLCCFVFVMEIIVDWISKKKYSLTSKTLQKAYSTSRSKLANLLLGIKKQYKAKKTGQKNTRENNK